MEPTKDFPTSRVTELQATLQEAWLKFCRTHKYGHYVAIHRQALAELKTIRNANHPSKLEQAKDKFSQLYLGKNGINAVSAKNKTGKIRVYADNADALNGIPNPFEGYALELKVSPPARLA